MAEVEMPSFTLVECARHSTEKDLWIIMNDYVYDVTQFQNEHPGGQDVLIAASIYDYGYDATEAFEDVGHSHEAREIASGLRIGRLKRDDPKQRAADIPILLSDLKLKEQAAANIPIFLSVSKPVFQAQKDFISKLSKGLESFGMKPQTLGVTDYDTDAPLIAIKSLMNHSAGLICVAFRRTYIKEGHKLDELDGRDGRKERICDKWLTTPWPHIEVGMAFQIDLPILILREAGVMSDGILEKGSSAFYLPTFDLEQSTQPYLASNEWKHIFYKWSREVKTYSSTKEIPLRPAQPSGPWPWEHDS